MKSEELLECPFCGIAPEFQPAAKDLANPPYVWPDTIMHNCKVIGRQICVRYDNFGRDENYDIVKAWNTRDPKPVQKATLDALKEAEKTITNQFSGGFACMVIKSIEELRAVKIKEFEK